MKQRKHHLGDVSAPKSSNKSLTSRCDVQICLTSPFNTFFESVSDVSQSGQSGFVKQSDVTKLMLKA